MFSCFLPCWPPFYVSTNIDVKETFLSFNLLANYVLFCETQPEY